MNGSTCPIMKNFDPLWAICDTLALACTYSSTKLIVIQSQPPASSPLMKTSNQSDLIRVDSAQASEPSKAIIAAVSQLQGVSVKPQIRFFSPTKSFLIRIGSKTDSGMACEKSNKSAASPINGQRIASRIRKRKSGSPSGPHIKHGGSAKTRGDRVVSGGTGQRRPSGPSKTFGSRRIARAVGKGKGWLLRSRD